MIDERKKELYNLLRSLLFEVIHKDKSSFLKIREKYDSLLKDIFDKIKFHKGEEGFEWVYVVNKLWIVFEYIDMEYDAIKEGDFSKKEEAKMLIDNSLENLGHRINLLKRFFEDDKNIDLKTRKRQLFGEYKKLYELAKQGERKKYDDLNRDCSEKVTEIFGHFEKGEEGFEWDETKNMIVGIFQATVSDNKDLLKHYEKMLKEKKKSLRRYLK